MKITKINKRMKHLQNVIDIQNSNGNWNYSEYMMGLANGLIMAKSIFTDEDPKFLSKPKKWLKDYPSLLVRLKWKLFGYQKDVFDNYNNEKNNNS